MTRELACVDKHDDYITVFNIRFCNLCPCYEFVDGVEHGKERIESAIARVRRFQSAKQNRDFLSNLQNEVMNNQSSEYLMRNPIINLLVNNLRVFNWFNGLYLVGFPRVDFDSNNQKYHGDDSGEFREFISSLQWLEENLDAVESLITPQN